MIINAQFPPIDGYNSASEAITASEAKSAEFQWFDPKLTEGQTIEAAAFGRDWFALRLSNGLRVTVRAAGGIIEASLDSEPLPPSQPFAEEVEIHSVGVNGPYHYTWRPQGVAESMIGHRIVFVTFHPHRLILVTPGDICAWFWLMYEAELATPRLKWTFGPG